MPGFFRPLLLAGLAALPLGAAHAESHMPTTETTEAAEAAPVRVAIHVDENDPARMTMALNNAANIEAYYADQGQEVEIEIVTYGPGLHMLRADTSPVADRIATMSLEYPDMVFSACENTIAGMERQSGESVPLIDEAVKVPSGAVRLIELQNEGWAYLRP
ncbi:MAG: hypothetical protein ABNH26_09230 [Celeribacter sp.]|jgi:intracellular sulfur oxidation DsrE/DsrF family protein